MKWLCFLLCCSFPGFQKESRKILTTSTADKIIKLEIKSLDAVIKTEISIECSQFEPNFKDHIITRYIEDKAKIDAFSAIINKAKAVPRDPENNIDTRGKIIVHYTSGKKDIFCAPYRATFFSINNEFFFELDDSSLSEFTGI